MNSVEIARCISELIDAKIHLALTSGPLPANFTYSADAEARPLHERAVHDAERMLEKWLTEDEE